MERYLRSILEIEYLVNFILLAIFYLHMFQLNSYDMLKNWNWIKKNKNEILVKSAIIIFSILLLCIRGGILASIFLMLYCIYINIQKKKAKISFKYTIRIISTIVIMLIIVITFGILSYIKNCMIIYMCLINIFLPVLIIISNYINMPIQIAKKNKYIKEAKNILNANPNLIIIGVTGTYGKTSVKNYLAKILSSKYQVLITPKNYNTTLGVVKTIRENLKATDQIFICEMGATRVGDIKEICDIVKPNYGIITSIGPQHLETFGNIENILETKFELLESVKEHNGKMFLNYSNSYIENYSNGMDNIITYGIDNESLDYNVFNINSTHRGITFNINKENIDFKTKIIGRHNAVNLAGCIAIARNLDISYEDIQIQLRRLENIEHRLNIIKRGELTIIDDAYNSNPVSSKSALDTLNEFKGIKILVTPGLIELNNKEYMYNFEFGKYAANICDYVFLVGKHSEPLRDGLLSRSYEKKKIYFVDSPEEAIKQITKINISEEKIVLLENDLPDNYK